MHLPLNAAPAQRANASPACATPCALPAQTTAEIAKASHDLNNLLTVIYSSLAMALDPGAPAGDMTELLEGAQRAAQRGAQLVSRIRHLASGEPSVPRPAAPVSSMKLDGTERILVLSGQSTVRLRIRAVLGYRGYCITEAGDPAGLFASLTSGAPAELVIADEMAASREEWAELATHARLVLLSPTANDWHRDERGIYWAPMAFDNDALAFHVRGALEAA